MPSFEILGLGTAVPDHFIRQSEAAEFAESCLAGETDAKRAVPLLKVLYRRSGVSVRHSVVLTESSGTSPAVQNFYSPSMTADNLGPGTAERMQRYGRESPGLAATACQRALQSAAVRPENITHLVTISCSGFSAPGFDLALIPMLGLSPDTARTHIGFMGCHGALNGLRVAKAFTDADPEAVVLVCATELCTLHHQYGWHPQQIVANSLFADGAAAVVGRAATRAASGLGSHRSSAGQRRHVVANASRVLPGTEHMMTWQIGDHGFQMTLSPEVPEIITSALPQTLDEFLSRHQLTIRDIPSWAIHPGGPRILKACAEAAALTSDQLAPSERTLAQYGNMSSPTVLFILEELLRSEALFPCVMLGFGPGLNVEMLLIR